MKKSAILSVLACAFCVLIANTRAVGAASLSAYPSGSDVLISVTGLSNVDAIDMTVTYDPQALSNAQAMQLSGFRWAMFLPNTAAAGTIRLAMLNTTPLSGSGPLAKISFSQGGKGATGVTIVYQIISGDASQKGTLRVTLNSGTTQSTEPSTSQPTESLVDTGQGENPADGSGTSVTDGTTLTSSTGTTSSESTRHEGVVVLPGMITSESVEKNIPASEGKPSAAEQTASVEEPPQAQANGTNETGDQHAPSPEAERPAPEPEVNPAPVTQDGYAVLGGVAARFRDYTGARTPKALMALFKGPVADTISQEPAICLTDGKTAVRITVDLSGGEKTAPNFALRGAALKSLKKGEGNRWLVEALPEAGAVEATLIIVTGRKMVEYPLTVAPRADVDVDGKGRVTEADFLLFLARKSVGPARSFDLNGDGKVDYLDDYIYTANYLSVTAQKKTRN